MVGFLVNGVLLSAEADASQVNAARIVVRLQSGKPRVAILGVRRRENQGFLLDHFQGAQVVRCEQQLAIRLLLDNLENFAQQKFENACIQFVNGKECRGIVNKPR
jgi:hypothetical protein